jgi:hypothetical protein
MKHVQSPTEMLNREKAESISKGVVAPLYDGPDLGSILCAKLSQPDTPPVSPADFRANTMKTRLRLRAWPYEVMKPEALAELDRLAGEGASLYQILDAAGVDSQTLHAFRWDFDWFDQLFNGLEYRAAYVRLVHGQ